MVHSFSFPSFLSFFSLDSLEEDAAPTATDALWTARTANIRVIVEQEILARFPVVFTRERSENIEQDIQTFVMLVCVDAEQLR